MGLWVAGPPPNGMGPRRSVGCRPPPPNGIPLIFLVFLGFPWFCLVFLWFCLVFLWFSLVFLRRAGRRRTFHRGAAGQPPGHDVPQGGRRAGPPGVTLHRGAAGENQGKPSKTKGKPRKTKQNQRKSKKFLTHPIGGAGTYGTIPLGGGGEVQPRIIYAPPPSKTNLFPLIKSVEHND